MLRKAAILHRCRHRKVARRALRNRKAVANDLRTAALDRVVVGHDAVVPNLVVRVQRALHVDQAIGKAVRIRVQLAALRVDAAALEQRTTGRILHRERRPALVHVALLGHV